MSKSASFSGTVVILDLCAANAEDVALVPSADAIPDFAPDCNENNANYLEQYRTLSPEVEKPGF
jgi:hypothetical protein